MARVRIRPTKKLSYEEFYSLINDPQNYIANDDDILSQVKKYENLYKMKSNIFYSEFEKGSLPEMYDFLHWAHLLKTCPNILSSR